MGFEGLYTVEELSFEADQLKAALMLNPDHWLFDVHFQNKPILPGAVQVRILNDLCSKALDRPCRITGITEAKFKVTIDPVKFSRLEADISFQSLADGQSKVKGYFFVLDGGAKVQASSITAHIGTDICFVVPFYNNPGTVRSVIELIQGSGYRVIAVNDGSTDTVCLQEAELAKPSALVSYAKNKGKGYALRQGFKKALELGFSYAVVFDADGQHTLAGAEAMIDKALSLSPEERLRSIIVGSRTKRGADSGGKFANNFSNFWLKVQTGKKLGDTQSGLRLYPLEKICRMNFLGNRYEFETEVLVKSAWNSVKLLEVPVDVIYPQDRVTHFRKGKDFTRISLMNTYLTLGALFYGYPKMLLRKLFKG